VEKNTFFGVQIDSNFSWKTNLPCFAKMTVTLLVKIEELKLFSVHRVTQNNFLGKFFRHQVKGYGLKQEIIMGKYLQGVVFFYVPTAVVSIVSCAQCGQI